ncbi:hypothetical protein MACK_000144 [Theileria orientalis]|uniref:Uncharacterized protein n=1 Tax=Theileria orientalis TaxID=68886 RepID=A0A976M9D5_THEOR|nr:hypothetical protein MACK_000144 [Theileria orientalis]
MEIIRRKFIVSDVNLNFMAVVFSKNTYFWVGDNRYTCRDLQCSFPLKNIKDEQSAGTTLLGNLDSISNEIANTLAKIYKRGIFMSVNIDELDSSFLPEFQEKLFKLIFELFPREKTDSSVVKTTWMEHHIETLDVSESTSNDKQTDSNSLNEPYKPVFSDKSKLSASMYDAESQSSESSMYEDFGDFDPSNFRLTPHTTISPKREACLSSEFKSIDSYDSFMVLSIADSEDFIDDKDGNKYKLEEDLVVDNSDDENLAVIDTMLRDNENRIENEVDNDKSNLDGSVSDETKKGDSIEEVFIDLETNSSEKGNEVTAGNVSFDINTNYNLKDKSIEKLTSGTDSSEERDSLDSGRIIQYFKHEKVSEVCKRLKEDLIGTREQNPEELPLSDELPFSERVYNYISDLKAYSTISSNEANYSRLSSVDFKALQTTETSDTLGADERAKDFEKELEPQEQHQSLSLYVLKEQKEPKKVLKEGGAPNSFEQQSEAFSEYDGKEDRSKQLEQRENEVIGNDMGYDEQEYDKVIGLEFRANSLPENEIPEDKQEYVQEEVDSKGILKERSFEMDLKSLQYPTKRSLVYQEEGSGREMMVENELNRDQYKKQKQQPQLQQSQPQQLQEKNYSKDDKIVDTSKSMDKDNVDHMKSTGRYYRLEKLNDATGVTYIGQVDSSRGLDYANRVDGVSGVSYQGILDNKGSLMYVNRGYDMDRVAHDYNFNEFNRLGSLERPTSLEKFNNLEKLNSLDRTNSINSVNNLDRLNSLDGLNVIKNPNTLQNVNTMQTFNSIQTVNSKSKYSKNERVNSVNEASYEDKTTTDRLVDENMSKLVSTKRGVGGEECESWEGLDCMLSSYGVNLVYSCLRSIKIVVGDNLHEYDVYTGTKKYMNEFIELLRRLNDSERKLRSDFISLEKNDYSLEATRNSYLSLMKENSRLKGLLNYYKNYLKLQRDTIKLKGDNIAVIRSEILSKLNQFQEVSRVAEKNERMLTMENSLLSVYDQTGFFILPLQNEGFHNFAYVINYNYYTHHVRSVGTVRDKVGTREERYREDGRTMKDSFAQRDEKARGELSVEMLEKLKLLESLPYKPRKIEPDLELKVFVYFESCTTTSSDQYMLMGSNSSNSSGSNYDFFGGNKILGNGDSKEVGSTGRRGVVNGSSKVVGKVIGAEAGSDSKRDEFKEINVNIDMNTNIDLYTLKNELKLVLYSPLHKDTPYYRFKHDLVLYFNSRLNTMFNEYLEDQSETLQLKEVLKKVVEITKELNVKFVYYLKQFTQLVKMSTNYNYFHTKDQQENHQHQYNHQHKKAKIDEFTEYKANNTLSKERKGEEYSEFAMSTDSRSKGEKNKNKVLRLMLIFKDNMPCLWCNVNFNFNHNFARNQKQTPYSSVTRERGINKDNLVSSVQFDFVHSLNKAYLSRYKDSLLQVNKLLTSAEDGNIVDLLMAALNSQRFYI